MAATHPLQVSDEPGEGSLNAVAPARCAAQAFQTDVIHGGRQTRMQTGWSDRAWTASRAKGFGWCGALVGRAAGEHGIEQRSQAVNVGAAADGAAATGLFRGEVTGKAGHCVGIDFFE